MKCSKAKKNKITDWNVIEYKNSKFVDPLSNKYPRWKGGKWTTNKSEREEVRKELYPFIEDFIKTKLKWKKMPKFYHNDTRNILVEFFVGKRYSRMVWRGGKLVKTFGEYPPTATGKTIMESLKQEVGERFTESEILNTLIVMVYKNRIDHYSLTFRPFVNTRPDKKEAVSLWDKISENVQV